MKKTTIIGGTILAAAVASATVLTIKNKNKIKAKRIAREVAKRGAKLNACISNDQYDEFVFMDNDDGFCYSVKFCKQNDFKNSMLAGDYACDYVEQYFRHIMKMVEREYAEDFALGNIEFGAFDVEKNTCCVNFKDEASSERELIKIISCVSKYDTQNRFENMLYTAGKTNSEE